MPEIIYVAPPTGNAEQDMAAINTAIENANKAYLLNTAAGKVTVQLAAGTYAVSGDPTNPSKGPVELLSGVALVGQGMGATTLRLVDGFNERINGIVRTALETVDNVLVADLTIDGNRANNIGHQAGFISGIKDDGSLRTQSNVTLSGVEVKDCTAYGFNPHEITTNLVIEDCVARGNGLDGFVADGVVGAVYRNNVSYDNDRHGFNIQNASTDIDLENNQAYGNGSAGLTIQRGDILREGETTIEWVTDIRIIGGKYYGNTKEGILVKLSDDVTIDGAQIYGNQRQGIRIEGATDTIVRNSTVFNNSQEADNTYDEIQIRTDLDEKVTGLTYHSTNTQILNNTIYSNGAVNARYGIREEKDNATPPSGTSISGNAISGMDRGTISVPGYIWIGTSGNDLMDGTEEGEELQGLAGNDTYIVNHSTDVVTEKANEGTDDHVLSSITYTLTSNVEHLTLTGVRATNGYGNELNNRLVGNAESNTLKAAGGHDTLDGGLGADILEGGDGNDTYYVDNAGDIVTEKHNTGLGGSDVIYSSVDYALPSEVEKIVLIGGAIRAWGNADSGNNLIGNHLDNLLDGLAGADRMEGGLGNDSYVVDNAGDLTIEAPGQGEDTIYTSIGLTLSSTIEHIVAIGGDAINLTGNELNNRVIGNAAANVLKGAAGHDTLDGGASADWLEGGEGDDTYYIDNPGDVVVENANGGYDTVYSSFDNALLENIERLILTGNSIWARGNTLSGNVLIGNAAANTLDGMGGADYMEGGLGNDTYIVDNWGDQVIEGRGGGIDRIFSSVGYTLSPEVEQLFGTGADAIELVGNALNNTITGNSGKNVLRGGSGHDTLSGGLGNDRLVGSTGKDVFVFDTKPNRYTNLDVITGFNVKDDTIKLENAIFKKLGTKTGKLKDAFFKIGSVAQDSNDYILYDSKSGYIRYDADGSGKGASIALAKLAPKLKITTSDFFVF
jgi:parallel beta-helix repeat protein